jgi:hypothetical protein
MKRKMSSTVSKQNIEGNMKKQRGNVWNGQL